MKRIKIKFNHKFDRFVFIMFWVLICTISCHDNPDDVGTHWDYSIECHDGFKYKILGNRRGIIPLIHKNGERVKCNETIIY